MYCGASVYYEVLVLAFMCNMDSFATATNRRVLASAFVKCSTAQLVRAESMSLCNSTRTTS
jgi:hypothetical protein